MDVLSSLLSRTVKTHLERFFPRHGIPSVVKTDNGRKFKKFSIECGFEFHSGRTILFWLKQDGGSEGFKDALHKFSTPATSTKHQLEILTVPVCSARQSHTPHLNQDLIIRSPDIPFELPETLESPSLSSSSASLLSDTEGPAQHVQDEVPRWQVHRTCPSHQTIDDL